MIPGIDSIWYIMNGKYGNNIFVRFYYKNGQHYIKIFLNTLIFLNDSYTFVKNQQLDGRFEDNNFITMVKF